MNAFRETTCRVPICAGCGGDLLGPDDTVPHAEDLSELPPASDLYCPTCHPIPYVPTSDGDEPIPYDPAALSVLNPPRFARALQSVVDAANAAANRVAEAIAQSAGVERSADGTERAGWPEVLKTPEEWLAEIRPGVRVLDPDGWRGRDGRPWTDPISRAEFTRRLVLSTQIGPARRPS
jgi:hypothetical protein